MCNGNESEFFLQPNLDTTLTYSLHIGSNFNGTFASFTFLTAIAFTAPHHCEYAVVNENFFCRYSVIKFIDF